MRVEPVPRRERQIFPEGIALGRGEGLAGDDQQRDRNERGQLLGPDDGRVLDRHRRGIGLQLDAQFEGGVLFAERGHQIVVEEVRGGAAGEPRRRADRPAGEFGGRGAVQIGRHAPIARVERVRHLASRDAQRREQFVPAEAERVQPGQEEAQRLGMRLECDVIGGIAHEERRIVDHDEVLRRRAARRHPHDLDRHAAPVADLVALRHARAVGEADPAAIVAGVGEQPLAQRRRKPLADLQHRRDAAVRLGMRVAFGGACARRVLQPRDDQVGNRGNRRRFFARHAFERRCAGIAGRDEEIGRRCAAHRPAATMTKGFSKFPGRKSIYRNVCLKDADRIRI